MNPNSTQFAAAAHPGEVAFQSAVVDARMARDFRRWKQEAKEHPDRHSHTVGEYEALARRAEKRVREAAIRAEIALARDYRAAAQASQ